MKHASLFSGIGGPEVAAEMLGWENVFHCEINPFGKAVLDYWFPNSESYEDITKTSFKKWRGRVDVLTGGFPCQPFSYAGKRGGREDERYLWPEMLRAIEEIRPTWVIGENVAGITTMVEGGVLIEMGSETSLFREGDGVHRYGLRQSFTIQRICNDLEHLGYSVQPVLIPAAAVGAPHRRDRVFIIAYDDNADIRNDLRKAGENEGEGEKERLQERDKVWQFGEPVDVRSEVQRTSADTDLQRCNKSDPSKIARGKERFHSETHIEGRTWNLCPEERWASFPTISPIHRGNDGLPFDVDDLTISFTKWRTESLKAYGNAIVPQVMYRIFQVIEKI